MFRNALRQSSRAVGAISATSRAAAVSPSQRPQTTSIHRESTATCSDPFGKPSLSSIEPSEGPGRAWASFSELPRGSLTLCFGVDVPHNIFGLRLTDFLPRHEMPHQQLSTLPQYNRDPTPTRPLPPRSRPFSSSGFAVSRRRPTSPRLAVFSPSGMFQGLRKLSELGDMVEKPSFLPLGLCNDFLKFG